MIFVVFNRLDVGAVCNACARGTALFTAVQELAENAFEQSVEIEVGHRNLSSVAEDAAEVDIHGVFDEVNAEQSLFADVPSVPFAFLLSCKPSSTLKF